MNGCFNIIIVFIVLLVLLALLPRGCGCNRAKRQQYTKEESDYSLNDSKPSEPRNQIEKSNEPISEPYIGMSEALIDSTELGKHYYDDYSLGGWSYTFLLPNDAAMLVKTENGKVVMIQRFSHGKLVNSTTETGTHLPISH